MRPAETETAGWVEEIVPLDGEPIAIRRPRDFEDLLTEEAFVQEELLPYWAHLWPSAVALAEELAPRALRGARTLELGCGLGLPSVVAARAGGRVTAMDWSPPALLATTANAERNGVEVETLRASWADPEPLVERGPWDLVIASDVLYERGQMDAILALLAALDPPEVLITDPGRATAGELPERAGARWDVRTQRSSRLPRIRVHRLRRRRP